MLVLLVASLAFLTSLFLTPAVGGLARRFRTLDCPQAGGRKRHRAPRPLWGGIAPYLVFTLIVLLLRHWRLFPGGLVTDESVIGLILGGAVLLLGGMIDDRFDLPPRAQFIFPAAAALIAVASGISIASVRSPFGGSIPLDFLPINLGSLFGKPLAIVFPGDLLSYLWILGMTYTTKVLDGLDGLVAGLALIGAVFVYALSLRPELNQPDVAVLAAAAAGSFGGFLVWNFYPARIFLGEGGSTWAGYLIGILSVISGSKVATALLVLGAPILDLALVIIGRARSRGGITAADLSHLHFRLLFAGLSERNVVILLYVTAVAFGSIGLVATTGGKAAAFVTLSAAVVLLSRFLERRLRAPVLRPEAGRRIL